MSKYRVQLGKYGEGLAADFFRRRGYSIRGSNYYTDWGEIDLIVENNQELLFIEVKTRQNNLYGNPEDAVNRRKINHLLKAVSLYLNRNKIEKFSRLDVLAIEVKITEKKAKIIWFKDAGASY